MLIIVLNKYTYDLTYYKKQNFIIFLILPLILLKYLVMKKK